MATLKEILLGEDNDLLTEVVRLSEDSADAQIDSILMGYQSDAVQQVESIDGKLNYHFSLLLEAPPEDGEEEEGGEPPEDDPLATPENPQTVGDDEIENTEPMKPEVNKIEIDSFAQKVYNLLKNHINLLNLEPVIINRAKKILLENGYDQNTLVEFDEILDREFGVSLDGEDEVPQVPFGGSAGPIS